MSLERASCIFVQAYQTQRGISLYTAYTPNYHTSHPGIWHHYPAHSTKKPVTTMLTYPWKCTVLHCNHLGNTWKPLGLMTQHFDYCPSASEGDNQSVRSSAPVVSRCFPGGYNVKLYISRGRLAWWLLARVIIKVLGHQHQWFPGVSQVVTM